MEFVSAGIPNEMYYIPINILGNQYFYLVFSPPFSFLHYDFIFLIFVRYTRSGIDLALQPSFSGSRLKMFIDGEIWYVSSLSQSFCSFRLAANFFPLYYLFIYSENFYFTSQVWPGMLSRLATAHHRGLKFYQLALVEVQSSFPFFSLFPFMYFEYL